MYQKQARKKKRKTHKKSILHNKEDRTCYLCMAASDYRIKDVLQEHHIYAGCRRRVSEEQGLKVYLCLEHHTVGPEAVHNNQDNMRYLQRVCQQEYEKTHTRSEWMELIGRNYIT